MQQTILNALRATQNCFRRMLLPLPSFEYASLRVEIWRETHSAGGNGGEKKKPFTTFVLRPSPFLTDDVNSSENIAISFPFRRTTVTCYVPFLACSLPKCKLFSLDRECFCQENMVKTSDTFGNTYITS